MQTKKIRFLCLFLQLSTLSLAQSCWRNTTCSNITNAAFPGPWDSYIFSPTSRTVTPKFILSSTNGQIISTYPGPASLASGTSILFDFGQEVGGILSMSYSIGGSGSGALGIAFTEAKNWIGEMSDLSNGGSTEDGAIFANFTGPGNFI